MTDGPRFNVTIKTGDDTGAGTDGNVYIKFVAPVLNGQGEYTTDEVLLDASGNDFEQGDIWTYPVTVNRGLEQISHIEVRLDLTAITGGNAWQLDWIVVEDTSSNRLWQAKAGTWFDHTQDAPHNQATDSRTQRFALQPVTPTSRYRYTVVTAGGTWSGSGSDAFIYMGVAGDSDTYINPLNNLDNEGNDFENGSRADYGPFTNAALSPPTKLKVRVDSRHPGDAWKLDWVGVEDLGTGKKYLAEVGGQWLGDSGPVSRQEQTYNLIEKNF